jgi:hypothetical protein
LPVDVAFAVIGDILDVVVLHIYVLGWLIHRVCLICERILTQRGMGGVESVIWCCWLRVV